MNANSISTNIPRTVLSTKESDNRNHLSSKYFESNREYSNNTVHYDTWNGNTCQSPETVLRKMCSSFSWGKEQEK